MLPVSTIKSYITYKIYHGSMTNEILNTFIKTQVLLFCTDENEPQSVLVMDYVSNHQNKKLVNMYYKADVLLAYLSLYLSIFISIETLFLVLKHSISKRYISLINLYIKEIKAFEQFLYNVVQKLANDIRHNVKKLFQHSQIQYF